jgi:hypothetical protein
MSDLCAPGERHEFDTVQAAAHAEALRACDDSPLGIEMAPDVENGDPPYDDFAPTGLGVSDDEGWGASDTATLAPRYPHLPRLSLVDTDEPFTEPSGPEPRPDAEPEPELINEPAATHTPDISEASDGAASETTGETGGETTRPQDVIKFRFVRADHSDEVGPVIAEQLAGCKTVVFEIAGGTAEERQTLEAAANTAVHATDDERQQALDLVHNMGGDWIASTLIDAPESVEHVRLCDNVSEDNPAFEAGDNSNRLIEEIVGGVGNTQSYKLREKLETYVEQVASSVPPRNENMAGEFDDLATELAAGGPQTVAVVNGFNHGTNHQLMEARGYSCESVLAFDTDPFTNSPAVPFHGEIAVDYMAAEAAGIEMRPTQAALDRALMELTYIGHDYTKGDAHGFVGQMTDVEIARTTSVLDHIRRFASQEPVVVDAAIRRVLEKNAAQIILRQALRD